MAVYKVIQDIEAEDKLLGPLTLRQFIYAGSAVIFFYLTFLAITKGAGFMAVVFLPIGLASGFFAWPWSRDQPTEIWALAKIRFMLKPRRRIWNQSGVKEMVSITAPKTIQRVYTDNLSQTEVENRLKALAATIDSRGWAIKNVNVNMYPQQAAPPSDRLIDVSAMPSQPQPQVDIRPTEDILEETNPVSKQFDSMIAKSARERRNEILENLRGVGQPEAKQPAKDFWFLNEPGAAAQAPGGAVTFSTQVVTPQQQAQQSGQPQESKPTETIDEQALLEQLHEEDRMKRVNPYARWHTIQPLSDQQKQRAQQVAAGQIPPAMPGAAPQMPAPAQQVTAAPDPAILQLANNDDLDVATIARQANKRKEELRDEVVISLH